MKLYQKIVIFVVPCFLLIAIFLKANGVDYLTFDNKYWTFASRVLSVKKIFTLAIPTIPMIPSIDNNLLDALFGFINALSNIINLGVYLINIVLEELAFIVGFLDAIVTSIKDTFLPNGIPI